MSLFISDGLKKLVEVNLHKFIEKSSGTQKNSRNHCKILLQFIHAISRTSDSVAEGNGTEQWKLSDRHPSFPFSFRLKWVPVTWCKLKRHNASPFQSILFDFSFFRILVCSGLCWMPETRQWPIGEWIYIKLSSCIGFRSPEKRHRVVRSLRISDSSQHMSRIFFHSTERVAARHLTPSGWETSRKDVFGASAWNYVIKVYWLSIGLRVGSNRCCAHSTISWRINDTATKTFH